MDREQVRRLLKSRRDLMCKLFEGDECSTCRTGKIQITSTGWKCSNCAAAGKDIIDLYQSQTGASLNETLQTLCLYIGEELGNPEIETETDQLKEYFHEKAKHKDPTGLEYLQTIGITRDTAEAYQIGYDEEKQCIIFPTRSGAVCYKTTGELAEVGPGVFNERALTSRASEIFITYEPMEAAAILEQGYTALSVNSDTGERRLADLIRRRRPIGTVILTIKSNQILEALKESGADYYQFASNILEDLKAGILERNLEKVTKAAARPDNITDYINSEDFTNDCKTYSHVTHTGYKELDAKFDGFRPGELYTIAAMPALGKTTFVLQMADQIAAAGDDVLFISLEQSKHEIASKSICRTLAQRGTPRKRSDIMAGSRDPIIKDAVNEYLKKIGSKLTVKQGNFGFTVNDVIDTIKGYIRKTGVKPIVIIDYLQILQPAEQRRGTKETVDDNITTLKRSARELQVPMVIISSINRSNYLMPVNYESLKESGSIEFSSTAVWGLDLSCLYEEELFFKDKEKNIIEKRNRINAAENEVPRRVTFKCLKNRHGSKDITVKFRYYPAEDRYIAESEDFTPTNDTLPRWAI